MAELEILLLGAKATSSTSTPISFPLVKPKHLIQNRMYLFYSLEFQFYFMSLHGVM
jgi:hypothetical protein